MTKDAWHRIEVLKKGIELSNKDVMEKGRCVKAVDGAWSPLKEPIAWGGPIVMNTDEELRLAFKGIDENTFIK
jgi:redox-sensitive bicupin YhaK (pirin superfamily)